MMHKSLTCKHPRSFVAGAGRVFIILLTLIVFISHADAREPDQMPDPDPSAKYVSIDFNDVDISVFIKFMSRLTRKNFIVDNRVKGNVTIISPSKITIKEAWRVFKSVLDINGFAVVEAGDVTKIVPSAAAMGDNVDTGPSRPSDAPEDSVVTRLVKLKYADAAELKTLFTPLLPKGSVILAYSDTNTLILTTTLSRIDRLIKIIDNLDVEGTGRKITIIPIEHADAEKLVKNISTIYKAKTKTTKTKGKNREAQVSFVADERTNSMILLASEQETRRISRLVEALDQEVPKGEEKIRVYYLEHADAEELVKVLESIPTETGNNKTGKKKAPILSEDIQITADKATNSLLITADKNDYPVLEAVIKKLDIPRAMVFIECLIMEINADKALGLGTEWRVSEGYNGNSGVVFGGFGDTSDTSPYANTGIAETGNSLPQGFSVGMLGKNLTIGGITFPTLQAVVQAYKTDKDVHILSTPQVLTTENEEATITVGKNVPYQTRSTADSGTETYSSYEYKDVGITLKITPSISQDRLVRLSVYQKVERLSNTDNDRPTTLKREVETTIIVEDANTVVIGGLIDESLSLTNRKAPCLGDIPVLGYAFKTESESSEKTNLYIFLTPKVVKTPGEAKTIYQEKEKEIKGIRREEIRLYDGEPRKQPTEEARTDQS